MGDAEDVVELSDLVEQLRGRRNRRFRRSFIDERYLDLFPNENQYTEWRLRRSAREMLDLLDRTPEAADVLLTSFLLNDPGDCKVVWFSNAHAILCEGPREVDTLNSYFHSYRHTVIVWSSDSSWHRLSLRALDDDADPEDFEAVLHLLHKVVALGTYISDVAMNYGEGDTYTGGTVPGMQDLVSLAQSPRKVRFPDGVSSADGRILAYHCNPMVELVANVFDWADDGNALAEAMLANQCPARLSLGGHFVGETSATMAPALASTTCIEELKILLPMDDANMWDAVAQNRGIWSVSVRPIRLLEYRHLKDFWRAALANTSGSHCSIDATQVAATSDIFKPGIDSRLESDRRECSEMIATMIVSNPHITSLWYDVWAHDPYIMETRVMPVVYWNSFRPIVDGALLGGGEAQAAAATASTGRNHQPERVVSALIGSPLVRCHPQLLYCLLKAGRNYLLGFTLPSLTTATTGSPTNLGRRASARLARKRRR